MIFYDKGKAENTRENVGVIKGKIVGRHPFTGDARPESTAFKMIGEMTLSPGASIAFHVHEADEEIYIITAGKGVYTDTDKKEYPVAVGDITLARRGEGHALANTGDGVLSFTAVIAE
ncbi:MAG: cupin domain-containing protein [Candidatus Adiutrix sp.]|jgi:mannose-6-phosphate isomerase-like protein (cupin superfamily)|nr:cupin domain-containing protein [Candidatus Adiutrix sp.]